MKYISLFAQGICETRDWDRIGLLGRKAAGLCTMAELSCPIPAGFALSTDAYRLYCDEGIESFREKIERQLDDGISFILKQMPEHFESGLSLSVRSSPTISMPGMMDSILNVIDRGQLISAIEKVFKSFNSARAKQYREEKKISGESTGCIIQAMVYGDTPSGGTGVIISNKNKIIGEFLPNRQGPALMSGKSTPYPISWLAERGYATYKELVSYMNIIRNYYGEEQEMEFTIENGKLWILQTRSADTTRIPKQSPIAGNGIAASAGIATGKIVFDAKTAILFTDLQRRVILIRDETSPDDIEGVIKAEGVVTTRGGFTCHAATLCRSLKKPCVTGVPGLTLYPQHGYMMLNGKKYMLGDTITIDGSTGSILPKNK